MYAIRSYYGIGVCLWESASQMPAGSTASFIVDNIYLEKASTIAVTPTSLTLDKTTASLNYAKTITTIVATRNNFV